ncbi:small GTP-binding domain protein [Mycobacterium xenopi 4042]|uniref:Small GTP-binding domain protein n=1 Tax=Mycobacterium xenopi 4042 TaxID=1299334 RepID=X8BI96_MYCXE|nr:small GTP-binding domain protein [Mycobacterium xenopi 4042]
MGKPNVGKSSLLNRLAGDQLAVVHEVGGTTVDPVDSLIELGGKVWRFIDTAGLRRKVGQASGHEYYASVRTHGAIDAAEVVIVLIDASVPLTEQDQRILSMVIEAGRALVLAFNKWDLVDEDRRELLEREIDRELVQLRWAQRVNISAKTGRAVKKLVPALEKALASWDTRISTGRLNAWLKEVVAATPPPVRGGRQPRILFATQASSRPPTFVLFTTGFLEAGYRRFLERRLRETFGFEGSPIRINVRVREKRAHANADGQVVFRMGGLGFRSAHFASAADRTCRCDGWRDECARWVGHTADVSDAGGARLPGGDVDDVKRGGVWSPAGTVVASQRINWPAAGVIAVSSLIGG